MCSDCLRLDGLRSVVFIATAKGWTGWGISEYSDCLRVDGLGSVVVIATGYGWTGWGA